MLFHGANRLKVNLFTDLLDDRKAARAAGHKTYFAGYKCLKGHLSPRRVSNGACCECLNLEKLKREAIFQKGVRKGRAALDAHRAAQAEAREAVKQAEQEEKRRAREEAREARQRLKAQTKRAETLALKKAGGVLHGEAVAAQSGGAKAELNAAPWD